MVHEHTQAAAVAVDRADPVRRLADRPVDRVLQQLLDLLAHGSRLAREHAATSAPTLAAYSPGVTPHSSPVRRAAAPYLLRELPIGEQADERIGKLARRRRDRRAARSPRAGRRRGSRRGCRRRSPARDRLPRARRGAGLRSATAGRRARRRPSPPPPPRPRAAATTRSARAAPRRARARDRASCRHRRCAAPRPGRAALRGARLRPACRTPCTARARRRRRRAAAPAAARAVVRGTRRRRRTTGTFAAGSTPSARTSPVVCVETVRTASA